MRIGILQCDDVRSSLSTEFGEYADMIQVSFNELDSETPFEFEVFKAHLGQLPDCVEEYEAYIITGSRHSILDSDALWINSLVDFIVRLNKAQITAIGIGFGHHLIAEAMGCKIERSDMGWLIGVHAVTVQHEAAFMSPKTGEYRLAMLSSDQVQAITEQTTVLAGSPKCPYAMLQFGDNMLGVQGRPEFSAAFAKRLLTLRQEEFPSKRFANGIASFSEQTQDNALMFSWFAHFIEQRQQAKQIEDEQATLEIDN